ncbi:nuclear transport factor 2 family protein [Rhodococcoides trifolii]|nr:nuclear transport factor 2 family protein [Rhodococcus trifolii]
MEPIVNVMRRNVLEVFETTDDALRRTLVESLYDADATWYEPESTAHGHEEIIAAVTALRSSTAGMSFSVTGDPTAVADLGRASWALSPPGAAPAVTGQDVAHVKDGKITALYTFLG